MFSSGLYHSPQHTYTRLGSEGNDLFHDGPVRISNGGGLECVAMSTAKLVTPRIGLMAVLDWRGKTVCAKLRVSVFGD